ncbi:MAG TPA: c-type cytochrome [Pseudomonadales bacterium]
MCWLFAVPGALASDAPDSGEKTYDVDCNQVDEDGENYCLTDKATYVGWRTFHANCHVCHGQNAVGSSFAPSLLKPIPKERFVNVVTNGYQGQIGVMPAWGKNPNVKDFIDELYAYQQARADGVLKPGRPKRKDD